MGTIMQSLNPALYKSIVDTGFDSTIIYAPTCPDQSNQCQGPLDISGKPKLIRWAYGPFHQFVYFPLILFQTSVASIGNTILAIHVIAILPVLYFFCRYYFTKPNNLLTIYIFAFTLGQFAFLDNLKQRNTEMVEFFLIFLALFAIKFKRPWLLGCSLSLAFLAKLLPLIFFPYLIIKKHFKALVAYLLIIIFFAIITELVLGFNNSQLLSDTTAGKEAREDTIVDGLDMGIPSEAHFAGTRPLAPISHVRGSVYTFILSFASEVQLDSEETIVSYNTEYFYLINWGFFAFCAIATLISGRYIYFNKSDTLFDFSIITCLMLLIFPRINPHYYIFCLFGMYYFLHAFLNNRQNTVSMKTSYKFLFSFFFVVISLLFGEFTPFSIIDRVINQDFPYFHFLAAYGLQGLATFLLWLMLILIGPEKCKDEHLSCNT
jgi:hypothetical protein